MRHLVFIVIVVLVILGGWLFLHRNDSNLEVTDTSTATSTIEASSTNKAVGDTGGSHPGLSYSEAVNIYATRRIQFDENCAATPNSIVVKNGTSFMFDNRSKNGRYIYLDRTRYFLRGYDFRILTLRSTRLPHTVVVDCAGGRNNAKITLD